MHLTQLRVSGFRNIDQIKLSFPTRITVLNGDNAQGKTNILETISILSSLRSFRSTRVSDYLSPKRLQAHLEADVYSKATQTTVGVIINDKGRRVHINGNSPTNLEDYLSLFQCVFFTPMDLDLSFGSQEMRRAYIDRAAFVEASIHLHLLRRYDKLLKHRNALLRDSRSELSIWNQQLAETGNSLRSERLKVTSKLNILVEAAHFEVTGGRENLNICWDKFVFTPNSGAETLLRELETNEEKDRKIGHTTTGPHRDRLQLLLSGRDTRTHASRGQQRTVALSLKLALLRWTSEQIGENPVFVLDDPGSELDAERLAFIGSFLDQWKGQVIIGCTNEANIRFKNSDTTSYYIVSGGDIEPVKPLNI